MSAEPGGVVVESRSAIPLTLSLLTGEAIIPGLILAVCQFRALDAGWIYATISHRRV
jgi:hypothetical protein